MSAKATAEFHPADALNAAIMRAQMRITAVAKASRNEFAKFNYTSAEDMIQAARSALHEEGVLVALSGWTIHGWESPCPMLHADVFVSGHGHRFLSRFQFPAKEEKGRPLDKAVAGALTMGLREWLRVFLLIPRVEEEPDARDDSRYEPQKAQTVRPRAPVKDDGIPF